MLRLADTSIKLYRKMDGSVTCRLHSYIMVHVRGHGFRLSAYLNQFDCSVTLESGEYIALNEYGYTYECLYKLDHMIHELWASGVTRMEKLVNTAGLLRIEYRLFSHPGQGAPDTMEQIIPVLARGPWAQRYSSDPSKWKRK